MLSIIGMRSTTLGVKGGRDILSNVLGNNNLGVSIRVQLVGKGIQLLRKKNTIHASHIFNLLECRFQTLR